MGQEKGTQKSDKNNTHVIIKIRQKKIVGPFILITLFVL